MKQPGTKTASEIERQRTKRKGKTRFDLHKYSPGFEVGKMITPKAKYGSRLTPKF